MYKFRAEINLEEHNCNIKLIVIRCYLCTVSAGIKSSGEDNLSGQKCKQLLYQREGRSLMKSKEKGERLDWLSCRSFQKNYEYSLVGIIIFDDFRHEYSIIRRGMLSYIHGGTRRPALMQSNL